jgi:hypothetical protein
MKFSRHRAVRSIALLAVAMAACMSATPADAEKVYVFDDQERRLLKRIFAADKYMTDMVKAHKFMNAINTLLSVGAPGPAKLPFKWNKAAFQTWKLANKQLDFINKEVTCIDLLFPIINESPNADFFEAMREARGCDAD